MSTCHWHVTGNVVLWEGEARRFRSCAHPHARGEVSRADGAQGGGKGSRRQAKLRGRFQHTPQARWELAFPVDSFAPLRKCRRLFAAGARLSMLSTCPRLRFWFNFSENSAVSPNVLNGRKLSRY